MRGERAIVLVTVIIFIIIVSMVAVSALFLMTNQARLTEHQIQRIKAFYAAQAVIQRNLMRRIQGQPYVTQETIDGIGVTASEAPNPPTPGINQWTVTSSY